MSWLDAYVIQAVAIIEKREPPVIDLNRHVSVIDFVPGLDGTSHHDAFAERDVPQYLADLTSGERGDCVQIILSSSHRLGAATVRIPER